MYKHTFTHNNKVYDRVTKAQAKKAYNNGFDVVFTPCKMRPFNNYFGLDMIMNQSNINCNYQDFEVICNEYYYYNCNSETGNYISYYVEVL